MAMFALCFYDGWEALEWWTFPKCILLCSQIDIFDWLIDWLDCIGIEFDEGVEFFVCLCVKFCFVFGQKLETNAQILSCNQVRIILGWGCWQAHGNWHCCTPTTNRLNNTHMGWSWVGLSWVEGVWGSLSLFGIFHNINPCFCFILFYFFSNFFSPQNFYSNQAYSSMISILFLLNGSSNFIHKPKKHGLFFILFFILFFYVV
jgi:hypothetical protein